MIITLSKYCRASSTLSSLGLVAGVPIILETGLGGTGAPSAGIDVVDVEEG